MKKQLLITLICILLATTTACSSGGSGEKVNKEKPKSKEGKSVVTLSLKRPDPFYEVVVKKFNEKYPDIDLQIQTFKQKGEQWDRDVFEKYIKTANTALLSGKGADIIEVGDLPVGKYANKKLLANMNDLMEQDKTMNTSDLHMNVLEAMELNGGLYSIPSAFSLWAFVGDGDVLNKASLNVDDKNWTWKQFEEVSRKLMQGSKERRYALVNNPPELILQELVTDSYPELVDRVAQKAKFDSPLFEEMMLQIKKMYDDEVLISKPADNENPLFSSERLFSPAAFIWPYGLFANPKFLKKPHGEGQTGGIRIFSQTELAIQANSPVKDEAWKFIAFLLSEEVQSLPELEGFSLLKSVNEKKLDDIQKQVKSGTYKLPNGKAIKVPDEDFAQFKKLINTADRYSGADNKVMKIIDEESQAFFSGQKSAEEVAKLIQNRVTTYLNE